MSQQYKVLVVDDDLKLRSLLERYLTEQGFVVRGVANGEQADRLLTRENFSLMVLDLMLPGEDGLSICRRLREAGNQIPVLMLTAKGDEVDRIVGLEMGADDYLPKPFEPRELVARLQTVLRRMRTTPSSPAALEGPLRFVGLEVDPVTRTAKRQGETLELTSTEFDLLLLLARAPAQVHSRDDILAALRGHDADLYTRAVDIVVSRLRKKLEPLDCIRTVRHAGYALALQPLTS